MRLDCPQCNRENVSMTVYSHFRDDKIDCYFVQCMSCFGPVIVRTWVNPNPRADLRVADGARLEVANLTIVDTFPRKRGPSTPEHVSQAVARVYAQAESALMRDEIDSATAMARKAVQLALGDLKQTIEGEKLHKAIDALVAAGTLPKALGEWAHAIRLLGNDGAHDRMPPTKEETADALAFTRYFLLYTFTLPKEVAAARDVRKARKDA